MTTYIYGNLHEDDGTDNVAMLAIFVSYLQLNI